MLGKSNYICNNEILELIDLYCKKVNCISMVIEVKDSLVEMDVFFSKDLKWIFSIDNQCINKRVISYEYSSDFESFKDDNILNIYCLLLKCCNISKVNYLHIFNDYNIILKDGVELNGLFTSDTVRKNLNGIYKSVIGMFSDKFSADKVTIEDSQEYDCVITIEKSSNITEFYLKGEICKSSENRELSKGYSVLITKMLEGVCLYYSDITRIVLDFKSNYICVNRECGCVVEGCINNGMVQLIKKHSII